ncbi:MAG TPA: DUF2911 domain-containing protein, partial [Longimicrobiales bacterium]|nr:DUF2911 domain-containing protein [Longimicrobiales bacterium]
MELRHLIGCALLLAATQNAAAQGPDSAAFVIRLGHDTTALERYVRTGNELIAEAVQRSPATTLHRLVLRFGADRAVTEAEYTVRRPGDSDPLTRRLVRFQGDSAVIENTQGGNTRAQRVSAPGAIPIAGPFYTPYELAIMRVVAGAGSVSLLPGGAPVAIRVERVGGDSVALNNQFDEPMRAHIDASGRILHLHTPAFATVERVRWIDLGRYARDFAARDAAGKGLGPLSPRSTVRRRIQNANIWLDYSRPAMRGRPVWGALVPWGKTWRMGANDAAHFATDRALQFGAVTIAPGTYTLFLMPKADRWELIVNRTTGMSGLD